MPTIIIQFHVCFFASGFTRNAVVEGRDTHSMQKLIDSQKRATEAFYQNPDVRSYFPSNLNHYVAAANQNPSKPEAHAQAKEMTSAGARSTAMPLSLLSQMTRGPDATSPNQLLQNNFGLIRNESMQHAILEKALRAQAFPHAQPLQQPPQGSYDAPTASTSSLAHDANQKHLQHEAAKTSTTANTNQHQNSANQSPPQPPTQHLHNSANISANNSTAFRRTSAMQQNVSTTCTVTATTSTVQQNTAVNSRASHFDAQQPAGLLAALGMHPPHSATPVPASQLPMGDYGCVFPDRPDTLSVLCPPQPRQVQATTTDKNNHQQPQQQHNHQNSRHNHSNNMASTSGSPVKAAGARTGVTSPEIVSMKFDRQSVQNFVGLMRHLTSSAVGRAILPAETRDAIMAALEFNSNGVIAHNCSTSNNRKSRGPKIKREFEQVSPTNLTGVDSGNDLSEHSDFGADSLSPCFLAGAASSLKAPGNAFSQTTLGLLDGSSTQDQPMPLVKNGVSKRKKKDAAPSQDFGFANQSNGLHPLEQQMFGLANLGAALNITSGQSTTSGKVKTKKKQNANKPHKCTFCSKSFGQKNHLVLHIRVHTGERPYQCKFCNKAFSRQDGLVVHQRSHTGEKPFKCDFCSSAFARNDKLRNHIRIHTGEKPFKCSMCGVKYSRKDKLTSHIRKSTRVKPARRYSRFCRAPQLWDSCHPWV